MSMDSARWRNDTTSARHKIRDDSMSHPRTGREIWLASLNNRPAAAVPRPTPFLQSVMDELSSGRKSNLTDLKNQTSSASSARKSVRRVYGNSVTNPQRKQHHSHRQPQTSRDVELAVMDANDQVFEMKKEIYARQIENNALKNEINMLKATLSKKDRELRAVLDEVATDPQAAATRPKAANLHLISSLKAKAVDAEHKTEQLQQALDKAHAKMKFTKIEELELEVTTYFNEVLRLRSIVNQNSAIAIGSENNTKPDTGYLPSSAVEVQQLKEKCTFLEQDNNDLRRDLDLATQNTERIKEELGARVDGQQNDEFDCMSRKQLLTEVRAIASEFKTLKLEHQQVIGDLEDARDKQTEVENENKHLNRQLEELRSDHRVLIEKARILDDTNRSLLLQLKEGPASLRDNLQPLLDAHTSSLTSRLEKLSQLEPLLQNHSSTLAKKLQILEEKTLAAAAAAQQDRAKALSVSEATLSEKVSADKQEKAARSLQRFWKKHHKQKKQSKTEKDEKISKLQAVLRGHAARRRILEELKAREWCKSQNEPLSHGSDSESDTFCDSKEELTQRQGAGIKHNGDNQLSETRKHFSLEQAGDDDGSSVEINSDTTEQKGSHKLYSGLQPKRPPTREKPVTQHHRFRDNLAANSTQQVALNNRHLKDSKDTEFVAGSSSKIGKPPFGLLNQNTSLQRRLNSSVETTDDEISDIQHPGLELPLEDDIF